MRLLLNVLLSLRRTKPHRHLSITSTLNSTTARLGPHCIFQASQSRKLVLTAHNFLERCIFGPVFRVEMVCQLFSLKKLIIVSSVGELRVVLTCQESPADGKGLDKFAHTLRDEGI